MVVMSLWAIACLSQPKICRTQPTRAQSYQATELLFFFFTRTIYCLIRTEEKEQEKVESARVSLCLFIFVLTGASRKVARTYKCANVPFESKLNTIEMDTVRPCCESMAPRLHRRVLLLVDKVCFVVVDRLEESEQWPIQFAQQTFVRTQMERAASLQKCWKSLCWPFVRFTHLPKYGIVKAGAHRIRWGKTWMER